MFSCLGNFTVWESFEEVGIKTQWHTKPPEGEWRPVWVTCSDGGVNWCSSALANSYIRGGFAIAWAEYTPEKPEPYEPPKEPTAEEIEAASGEEMTEKWSGE